MKAIRTKYHGPTNTRGSRISASDEDGNRVSIPYPHELDGEECHRKAAVALCQKMNWTWEMVAGGTKDGYVFVFTDKGTAPDLLALLNDCEAFVSGFEDDDAQEGIDGEDGLLARLRAALAGK